MYKEILNKFVDKNIAILGFGREGKSTYKFLRRFFPDVKLTIVDKNINISSDSIFNDDKNVLFKLGDDYLSNLDDFDIIVKSSGISLNYIDNKNIIERVVSQYSLVLENCNYNIIGVTGTKGKSTTSSLLYKVFKDNGKKTLLLGNIGVPIFDYIDEIDEDTIVVLELSAYQLEYIKKAPKVSILLNLYEEHLDYFGSKDKYFNAKLNILNKQNEDDFGFYLDKNKNMINAKSKLFNIGKDIYIKDNYIYFNDDKLYDITSKRNLLGEHNLTNIMFVLGVASIYKLDMDLVVDSINSFKGLEHRMELVGEYDGVIFYNDTIATVPEATINCINTLGNVDTLIFGGMDRGINYDDFVKYLRKSSISNFICMPEVGDRLGKLLEDTHKNIYYLSKMSDVVDMAKKVTRKGAICLLSPAAPSYNDYKNFEEKGRIYKECIRND